MKKRFLGAIYTLVAVMLACSACASTQPSVEYDTPLPWANTTRAETCTYEVSYARSTVDSQGELVSSQEIASGTLSFVLRDDWPQTDYTQLEMNFALTFGPDAPAEFRSLTDTITSSVTSYKDMGPTHSVRTVDYQTSSTRYTIEADYVTGRATRTADGVSRNLTLRGGSFVDNEMVFYAVRAMSIDLGSSHSFNLVNMFDSFEAGSMVTYPMKVLVNSGLSTVSGLPSALGAWGLETDTDGAKVDCRFVTMLIDSTDRSGPALSMYYADQPLTDGTNNQKKVLVKFFTRAFDYVTFDESYRMTFSLASLSV